MTERNLLPHMRDLFELIDEAHALALASLQEHHRHGVNAGELLREAVNLLPPMTAMDWVGQHTQLTPRQAQLYLRLYQTAALLADTAQQVEGLTPQQADEYRQAYEASQVLARDEWGFADAPLVTALLKLCKVVLGQLQGAPDELASVEVVLNGLARRLTAQLTIQDGDSRLFVVPEA